ncbi:MAG: transglycosylase SLT domain-containing protein [Gemmatimonadota bacterium]
MPRFTGKVRATLSVGIPAAVLALGFVAGSLRSSEWSWRSPILAEVRELAALAPVRALPRTEAVLATLEAQRHLSAGRPYAAWQSVRPHVDMVGIAGPTVNLLAAEAASGWQGWTEARGVLKDRPWLTDVARGDGLLLLARAEEELGNPGAAIQAYRRYVAVSNARERGTATARMANLLAARGDHGEAAAAYESAAEALPGIADWLRVLRVEQLVAAGDPAAISVATGQSGGSAPVRLRRVQLEADGWRIAAETGRAMQRLEWEARVLNAEGARAEAALLELDRARLLLGSADPTAGRVLLRVVAADARVPGRIRMVAASELGELDDLEAADELARADAYEAAGRPGLAARSLRAAFEMGAPDWPEERFRLARLLYEERDYGPARTAYQRATNLLPDHDRKAEAALGAARSSYRLSGSRAKQTAVEEFRDIVERYDGTAAAGSALFLLGDAAATNEAGIGYYRRAAAVTTSPDARDALWRVGDRSLREGDRAGAIRAWEEYVSRYPRGEQTTRVAYEVGKLHEAAGRRDQARTMYNAAVLADPVAYYAVRAAERLGIHSLDHVLDTPRPWVGLASEPAEAAAVLQRMDHLRTLGLEEAREAEYDSALRSFERKPLARLVLAEGVRDRFDPVGGIQLGRELLAEREGVWDERLLRVVFPFLYRGSLVAEAERAGVDPIFYAALVRQESTFRASVKSWVGATGLGQIMPATGRWLAPAVGIRDYEQSMLEVPEINLRMGTKYIGDLLRRYDGAKDLALAGYNAGPGRADRWRRQFDYGRDIDAFRESIPFDETRNYVKIVLRNEAIYRRLYGDPDGEGVHFTD